MKRIKLILGLIIFTLIISISTLNAQPTEPPGGTGTGSGGTPIGGNAPLGAGVLLFAGFGLAYAGKKIFDGRKKN